MKSNHILLNQSWLSYSNNYIFN